VKLVVYESQPTSVASLSVDSALVETRSLCGQHPAYEYSLAYRDNGKVGVTAERSVLEISSDCIREADMLYAEAFIAGRVGANREHRIVIKEK